VAKRASTKKRAGAGAKKRSKTARKTPTVRRRKAASAARRGAASRAAAQTSTQKRKTAARSAASRSTTSRKPAATVRKRKGIAGSKPSRLSSAATAVRGAVAGAVASVTARLPWTSGDLDAIALLEKDHRRFEELLAQGEETTERAVQGRSALLETLTSELNAHELVEEQILYPALKAHPEARDIVLEGFQEHHVADVIVAELHSMARDDERWGAKFKVLKESLEHHIKEEEGEMFRTARGLFNRDELQQMGARMAKMKAGA
jgi:hypothetical protein